MLSFLPILLLFLTQNLETCIGFKSIHINSVNLRFMELIHSGPIWKQDGLLLKDHYTDRKLWFGLLKTSLAMGFYSDFIVFSALYVCVCV